MDTDRLSQMLLPLEGEKAAVHNVEEKGMKHQRGCPFTVGCPALSVMLGIELKTDAFLSRLDLPPGTGYQHQAYDTRYGTRSILQDSAALTGPCLLSLSLFFTDGISDVRL